MARNTSTQAPAAQPKAAAPVDVNALRAQREAIDAQLKALKATTDGKVEHIGYAEDDPTLLQLDIRVGDGTRLTKDGRAYLFATDGLTFVDAKGQTWQVSAMYAVAKKA